MTISSTFRTLAFALRNVPGLDTYGVLNAADAVESTVEGLVAQGVEDYKRTIVPLTDEYGRTNYTQDVLNAAAAGCGKALVESAAGRKINAIKEVRTLTNCGLKGAKDAVESVTYINALKFFNQARLDRDEAERAEAQERRDSWCCEDCHGPEPLAEWERELLSGNARNDEPPF